MNIASEIFMSPTPPSKKRSAAALADRPIRALLDLGTGTGRMLELFANDIERGLGLDLSLDMLALALCPARSRRPERIAASGRATSTTWRCRGFVDVAIIHQVLHFLDDSARAIREAVRMLRPGRTTSLSWTLRRMISNSCARSTPIPGSALRREAVTQWLQAAGLDIVRQQTLPPGSARQDRGLALARPRSAHRAGHAEDARGRLMDASVKDASSMPASRAAFGVLLNFSAENRGDGVFAVGGDQPAGAARAEFRFRHIWRRRLDA